MKYYIFSIIVGILLLIWATKVGIVHYENPSFLTGFLSAGSYMIGVWYFSDGFRIVREEAKSLRSK